jgi:hypothetical protein
MPPGLCPCWLLADARHVHVHPFSHPERPHSHDYLFEISSSSPGQTPPALPSPRDLVAGLQSSGDVWTAERRAPSGQPAWSPPTSNPPPRPAAA